MSCPSCFEGHVHTGTPRGQTTKIHGLDTYVAEPATGVTPKGIIVIVPDAFGWEFVNNRLLADHYAEKGSYKVYLPDFMEGHYANVAVLQDMKAFRSAGFLAKPYYALRVAAVFVPFLYYNRMGLSNPRVKAFLETLRTAEGAGVFVGTAGFCWGAKHLLLLAHGTTVAVGGGQDNHVPLFDAAFVAHPSFFADSDIADPIAVPLAFALGDNDPAVPAATIAKIRRVEALPAPVTGEVVVYENATHGFAIRADEKLNEFKQAEAAELQALAWFDKHLK